jgi:hypothetical protein
MSSDKLQSRHRHTRYHALRYRQDTERRQARGVNAFLIQRWISARIHCVHTPHQSKSKLVHNVSDTWSQHSEQGTRSLHSNEECLWKWCSSGAHHMKDYAAKGPTSRPQRDLKPLFARGHCSLILKDSPMHQARLWKGPRRGLWVRLLHQDSGVITAWLPSDLNTLGDPKSTKSKQKTGFPSGHRHVFGEVTPAGHHLVS